VDEDQHGGIAPGGKDVEVLVDRRTVAHVEDAFQPVPGELAVIDIAPGIGHEIGHRALDIVFGVELLLRVKVAVERSAHGDRHSASTPAARPGRPISSHFD
jgi:hypothetical protein